MSRRPAPVRRRRAHRVALVAGVLSAWASTHPDGLSRVATSLGFADRARDSAASGSPLADYATTGVSDPRLSGGLAGVVGVVVVGSHGRFCSSPGCAARPTGKGDVGTGHSDHLHVDGDSALHRMPAHAKLVGLVLFVCRRVGAVDPAVGPRRLLGVSTTVLLTTRVAGAPPPAARRRAARRRLRAPAAVRRHRPRGSSARSR